MGVDTQRPRRSTLAGTSTSGLKATDLGPERLSEIESLPQEDRQRPWSSGQRNKCYREWAGHPELRGTQSSGPLTSDTSGRRPPGLGSHSTSAAARSECCPRHSPRAALRLQCAGRLLGQASETSFRVLSLLATPHSRATQAAHSHLQASVATTQRGRWDQVAAGRGTREIGVGGPGRCLPAALEVFSGCQANWILGQTRQASDFLSTGSGSKDWVWFSLTMDRMGWKPPYLADGTMGHPGLWRCPASVLWCLLSARPSTSTRGRGQREEEQGRCCDVLSGPTPLPGVGASWAGRGSV